MAEKGSSEFHQAAKEVKELSSLPPQDDLLKLYGLFKQVTVGDADDFYATEEGKKVDPGMFDLKGKAKKRAWQENKGKSTEEAEHEYIQLVATLKG